jgi:hypothetical protein
VTEEYRIKIFLGELTLGDLWKMGLLEGMMTMGEEERITAGQRDETIEFCGPDGLRRQFSSSTKVKLNTSLLPVWAVDFNEKTLVLSRGIDPFLKDEKN